MPKNQGKKGKDFEAQFKKSCDNQGICAIRLIDSNKFGKHVMMETFLYWLN